MSFPKTLGLQDIREEHIPSFLLDLFKRKIPNEYSTFVNEIHICELYLPSSNVVEKVNWTNLSLVFCTLMLTSQF